MREILFKAKRNDNGEWVYWNVFGELCRESGKRTRLALKKDATTLYYDYIHQIRQLLSVETICQFTGLTDKNGNKIWENDIAFVMDGDGNSGQIDTGIGEIDFLEGLWYISGRVQNSLYDINKCFQIEVIGNIFDNPELLKKD